MTPKFATPPELTSSAVGIKYEATPARPVPFPLVLQRRAGRMLRQHLLRGIIRGAILILADMAALSGLQLLKLAIRDQQIFGSAVAELTLKLVPLGSYPAPRLMTAMILSLIVLGNYGQGDHRRDPANITLATLLGFGLLFWGRLWDSFSLYAVLGFIVTVGIAALALIAVRHAVDVIVRRARPSSQHARTLVVGPAESARQTLRHRPFRRSADFFMVGFVHTDSEPVHDALGSIDQLVVEIEKHQVDTVILSGSIPDETFLIIVDVVSAAGCQVFSLPRYFHGGVVEPRLVWRRSVPLIQLSRPSLRGQQLALKRVMDIVGSLCALLSLSPLLALIAALIRLDSRGPVLFRQERIGLGGRCFRMLKFRTMGVDADRRKAELAHLNHTGDPRLFKIPDDPRVTRVGRWLRKWSLDELPQLWNVLRGDMSLVGPRPFFEADTLTYDDHHFWRLGAKPGMTGLWQVSGRSSVVDFEEVVRLDRQYVHRWSLWMDLRILLQTPRAVVRRTGAF